MFPGSSARPGHQERGPQRHDRATSSAIEMAAHGGTVIEIRKVDGKWAVVTGLAVRAPHHRDDADGDHRPGARARSA